MPGEVNARDLERARRRTLARFLTAPEPGDAMWTPKTPLEPEILRATHGSCNTCCAEDILHRFTIDERHVQLLACVCADGELLTLEGRGICDAHLGGFHPTDGAAHGRKRSVWCHANPGALAGEFQDSCRVAWWLDTGHLPWLCPRCWNRWVSDEGEHIAAIQEPPLE